jgi:hypothetical protein
MAWAPDYVTDADLSSYLRIDDNDDDAELALAITAASRAIDHHCGRQFGNTTAEERTYIARPDYERGYWVLDTDDYTLITGAGVVVTDAGTVTTYVQEPRNASQKSRPWTRVVFTADSEFQPDVYPHEVNVSALWGWAAVPTTVKQATMLQASRFFTRRNAPFGIAGSPDSGSEMRLLAKVDADVAVTLRDYVRVRSPG